MKNNFIRTLEETTSVETMIPNFYHLTESELGKVRITDVKCMRVQLARGNVLPLIKIETDSGVYGLGECRQDVTGLGAKDVIENAFKQILVKQDPFNISRLTEQMKFRISYLGGNGGIGMHAVTGCEIALWDLVGKLLSMPLRKILGGGCYTDRVRAYLTSGPTDMLDPASCREWIDYINQSVQKFTAAKPMRITQQRPGGSALNRRLTSSELDGNSKAFANLREAVGLEFEIIVHCHWEFGFFDALSLARAVEPIRPWWLEDPLPIEYVDTWVKLTESSPVPILCGENLYTLYDFLPFIINQGVHMIEIDISQAGGLLEAKKIASLANAFYMPVATHNVTGPIATIASANCAATIFDFIGHEINFGYRLDYSKKDIYKGWDTLIIYDQEIIKDGYIQLSDKPGLGLDLNKEVVITRLEKGEKWWGN